MRKNRLTLLSFAVLTSSAFNVAGTLDRQSNVASSQAAEAKVLWQFDTKG